MQFSYEVKIPKDRVAVLIGVKGSVKKEIQNTLSLKLTVDSKEGDVFLEGDDSLKLLTAQNIVKAIGRGFNPETALELLNENAYFDMVDISNFTGDSRAKFLRIKARVIGTDGKARKTIENLTHTSTVVYGKTISIIGDYEGVSFAKRAFEALLSGSRHSGVYSFLEKSIKRRKNVL